MQDILDLIEQNFRLLPEKKAVYAGNRSYTYADIDMYSSRIYSRLKHWNIKPEDVIMIDLEDTLDKIIAYVGVLKAGAAFLFIDHGQSSEVTRYMYEECGCKMLIDGQTLQQMLNEKGDQGHVNVDPHTAAYIMYTSGSTRRPKGVVMERGAMSLCAASLRYNGKDIPHTDDRIALLSPLTFAAGMILLNIALSKGMTLYAVPGTTISNPSALKEYFREHRITVSFMTPAYYRIVDRFNPEMRVLVLGGEKVSDIVQEEFEIYNMYGQTESGFVAALHRVNGEQGIIPIGTSQLTSSRTMILNENGDPVKAGEQGEICYENPFFRGYVGHCRDAGKASDHGLVRSGDIGRLLPNGEIVVTGRKDDMVKIHGLWVDPSEVEEAVKSVYETDWVYVKCMTENTRVFICVYYTGNTEISIDDARKRLREVLPDHSLPTHMFRLDKVDINHHGKTLLQHLPMPNSDLSLQEDADIPDELERELNDIVCEVLESRQAINADANLISLGMSSLSVITLIGLLEERFRIQVSLSEIMEKPDIANLSRIVRNKQAHPETDTETYTTCEREYIPLTKNQLGILAECVANKNSVQYNIPSYMVFPISEVNPDILKSAFRRLSVIHSSLKTRIIPKNDVPADSWIYGCEVYQKIFDEELVIETECIAQSFPDTKREREYFQELVKPYSIFHERLYRIRIIESPDKVYAFFDVHHIIADGFSLKIMTDDLSRLISGQDVENEKLSFPAFILQEEENDAFGYSDQEYKTSLMAETESFKYPYYSPQAAGLPRRSAQLVKTIPAERIIRYCREKGFTESSYFHSALLLTLYLLGGEAPFIASTYNGRSENAIDLMRTFGLFARSVPVVWKKEYLAEAQGQTTPEALIRQIQRQIMNTCERRDMIYSTIHERTDILMTYQGELGYYYVNSYEANELMLDTPKFPISIMIKPKGMGYNILLDYDITCFLREDMELLEASFIKVLSELYRASVLSDILLTDCDISLLSDAHKGAEIGFSEKVTWLDEFAEQVRARAGKTAVCAGNGEYTYKELDELSDKVACYLLENNVRTNDFVAVRMPRIKEFSAAIIGIHKCGAAYVPVDMDNPPARMEYILHDSEAKILLTEETMAMISGREHKTFVHRAVPDGNAYMIYTSGSTGLPKGVVIQHRALYNYLQYVQRKVGLDENCRISCYASFSFDISVEGLFAPLIAGGAVWIVPSSVRKDIRALETFLRDNAVTGGCFPTQIGQLLGHEKTLSMDYITLIGEKMTAVPVNSGRVFNAYGPTECTVVVSYYEIEKNREYNEIPIGKPMYNTMLLILDPFGGILPDGAVGELCIGGEQLSKGYHHNPEKTSQAFTPLKQDGSIRIYHTGDLAKFTADGELIFLGRRDRQIKRRGFRIEPGEIESAALKCDAVKEVFLHCVTEKLILYYTLQNAAGDTSAVTDEIAAVLAKELPDYMLPDGYMELEEMPLTPNGKIDISRLPEYHFTSSRYTPPRNQLEISMCQMMSQLLGVDKVGINDDFFELGGNSLDVVQFLVMLGDNYELADIYNGRTVSGIIREGRKKKKVNAIEQSTVYPLTEEQKKFFFVEEMGARPEISYANVPMLFQLPDDTDMELLRSALLRIIDNHPYLKVRFRENPDMNAASDDWYVAQRDDTIPPEVQLYRGIKPDKATLIKPYNLIGNENLYRIALYDSADEKYIFLDFHHVLYDGESLLIMINELKRLMAGQDILPEIMTGYEAAEEELQQKIQHKNEIISFYHELLKNSDKKLNDWINDRRDIRDRIQRSESFDETKGLAQVMNSRVICVSKSRVDMKYVRERCKEMHITENMFFNAAFACLLGECNGKSEALYANVIRNRDVAYLKNTVTMMCRTVPLYLRVTEKELSTEPFLKQLRKAVANAQKGCLLTYENICNSNKIIVPRITMIFRERPSDEEVIPGCRQISLNNLESIDTLMVKIYFNSDDTLYVKFDTSLDFSTAEINVMTERLDELFTKI